MEPRISYWTTIAMWCRELARDHRDAPGIAAEMSFLLKLSGALIDSPSHTGVERVYGSLQLLYDKLLSLYARFPENRLYERLYLRIENLIDVCLKELE